MSSNRKQADTLRKVVFYTAKELPATPLIQQLNRHLVQTEQFLCKEGSLPALPQNSRDTIYITDNGILCQQLLQAQFSVIALLGEESAGEDFGTVKYASETIQGMDYTYLNAVWRRYVGLPWSILETKRCLVREITVEDVESLYTLYREPSITAYMEELYPEKEREIEYTRQYIEQVYGFYEYGMWIVEEKESGCVIGRAGFEPASEEEGVLMLGYMIGKPYQRKGYAAEVCQAIVTFAFDKLKAEKIYTFIEKENHASIALVQKMGFLYYGEKRQDGKEYVHYFYNKHMV